MDNGEYKTEKRNKYIYKDGYKGCIDDLDGHIGIQEYQISKVIVRILFSLLLE